MRKILSDSVADVLGADLEVVAFLVVVEDVLVGTDPSYVV
jgi:hypothetical protein